MAATFLDYQSMHSQPSNSNSSHQHDPLARQQSQTQSQKQKHSHPQSTALPTPPPSPPMSRRRPKKKEKDPFLSLTPPTPPSASSSSTPQAESAPAEHDTQWRITKLLHLLETPFLITSFILSFALVSLADRARRVGVPPIPGLVPEPYPPSSSSSDSDTSPADQPHQQPTSGRWKRRDSAHVGPSEALNPRGMLEGEQHAREKHKHKRRKPWHLHRKIRKIARVEATEAFELRKWIIAMMLATGVLGVVGAGWGVWWIWVWLRRWW